MAYKQIAEGYNKRRLKTFRGGELQMQTCKLVGLLSSPMQCTGGSIGRFTGVVLHVTPAIQVLSTVR